MARDIKVVLDIRIPQQYHIKNVGDQLANHEALAAARWQDEDGVKVFGSSPEANRMLQDNADVPNLFDVTTTSYFSKFVEWENDQFSHNWENWESHPDQGLAKESKSSPVAS